MSDAYDENEYQEKELEYDNQMASLNAIASLENEVTRTRQVDRVTMESLQRIDDSVISPQFPLATYTTGPSEQNYDVALESFSVAKSIAIAAAGGILGAILMYIIKLFRSDGVDTRMDHLNQTIDEIKSGKTTLKDIIKDARKLELTAEQERTLDRIEAFDVELVMGKAKRADREVEQFLKEIGRNGSIHRTLAKWSGDIVQRTSEFRKRIRLLTECVDTMYEVEYEGIQRVIKKAEEVTLKDSDRFINDIGAIHLLWEKMGLNEEYSAFIKDKVIDTEPFREMISDDGDLGRFKELYSSAADQLEKNMKEIEKYARYLTGGAREESLQRAKRAKQTKTSTNGNDTVIEVSAVSINPMLLSAVQRAEDSVRLEADRLKYYRLILERVLHFYQHAVAYRQKVNIGLKKQAMEIQNAGQPK